MKYQFIYANQAMHRITELFTALGVKPSSYYSWLHREPSARRTEDEMLKECIEEIEKQAQGRYGYRSMYHHLQDDGIVCGRDRTLRLMSELGIKGLQEKSFKPIVTDSKHRFGYSENLLKKLGKPTAINQVWVADTTYLLTENGWQYLATVMDLFSRYIIGWSISENNDTQLVCDGIKAAVITRGELPEGIIHHSDRGSTYASHEYLRMLRSHQMKSSMSAKGNCYDNAAMESFYGRYKSSSVRGYVFADEAELRANVFEYIELFYNRFRKHSSLEYKSPLQFEENVTTPMEAVKKAACFQRN
jgi:putative transposase